MFNYILIGLVVWLIMMLVVLFFMRGADIASNGDDAFDFEEEDFDPTQKNPVETSVVSKQQ